MPSPSASTRRKTLETMLGGGGTAPNCRASSVTAASSSRWSSSPPRSASATSNASASCARTLASLNFCRYSSRALTPCGPVSEGARWSDGAAEAAAVAVAVAARGAAVAARGAAVADACADAAASLPSQAEEEAAARTA
eukprot:scaffold142191_cov130-Phaeocystis_antarctica.AAC.1